MRFATPFTATLSRALARIASDVREAERLETHGNIQAANHILFELYRDLVALKKRTRQELKSRDYKPRPTKIVSPPC